MAETPNTHAERTAANAPAESLVEALVTAQHNLSRTYFEGEHAHRRGEMERARDAARAALERELAQLRADKARRPDPAARVSFELTDARRAALDEARGAGPCPECGARAIVKRHPGGFYCGECGERRPAPLAG